MTPASRVRPLLWLLALAAAAALTDSSSRHLKEVEHESPPLASVPRFRLEVRAGKFHRHGSMAAFTGWMTDHFEDGTVKLRSAVVDGRLHGMSVGWFTNGVRELREHFHRGLPHGMRTTWHANGRKRSEGQLFAGLQEGCYRQWHENGDLAVEAEFKEGKPHGLSRAWYPSGFLKAEVLMKHGEIQIRHSYLDGVKSKPTLQANALDSVSILSSR
ncbi:MAG: hypothetical protein AB1813_01480 [Verrucomicrobiota bacterium]